LQRFIGLIEFHKGVATFQLKVLATLFSFSLLDSVASLPQYMKVVGEGFGRLPQKWLIKSQWARSIQQGCEIDELVTKA
jgi:hypothetical protein